MKRRISKNAVAMKFRWVVLALIGFAVVVGSGIGYLPYARAIASNTQVRYHTIERSHYTIHTVIIPHDSNYIVVPEIGELKPISEFAQQDNIVAAINGG